LHTRELSTLLQISLFKILGKHMKRMTNPDLLPIWKQLKRTPAEDELKIQKHAENISIFFHHQHANQNILNQLIELCHLKELDHQKELWLKGQLNTIFCPKYTLLRNFEHDQDAPELKDVIFAREKIAFYSEKIRQKQWLGCSGEAITDVVNIGMGGSDLGPKLCCEALSFLQNTSINCHFISDADHFSFQECLKPLNPASTLFLISSKSFKTEETLYNFEKALAWINHPKALEKQFIAITANTDKAQALGFQHILPIWDWVVGRFSCCSAINLISAILLGYQGYEEFLYGAHEMDKHFLNSPLEDNLSVLLALIGLWNINFLNIPSQLLLIHDYRLRSFVNYIQQLEMESNGKTVNQYGQQIHYRTAPIIWGGLGNPAHHSYYQLLAQGSHQVAIDFLGINSSDNPFIQTLCDGRELVLHHGLETKSEVKNKINKQIAINHIQMNQLKPKTLGTLIALYEHKVFTQAWLWNINPFDQPGVEAAKAQIKMHQSKTFVDNSR
jgi:glucose-6-phosphate isomerase